MTKTRDIITAGVQKHKYKQWSVHIIWSNQLPDFPSSDYYLQIRDYFVCPVYYCEMTVSGTETHSTFPWASFCNMKKLSAAAVPKNSVPHVGWWWGTYPGTSWLPAGGVDPLPQVAGWSSSTAPSGTCQDGCAASWGSTTHPYTGRNCLSCTMNIWSKLIEVKFTNTYMLWKYVLQHTCL